MIVMEFTELLKNLEERLSTLERSQKITSLNLTSNGPFVLPVATADQSSPVQGQVYYNSTTNRIKVYTGSGWETVTSA